MDDIYFDGDPAVDSTRRQMERLMKGQQPRRWPWVVAAIAGGGAAFVLWRHRARRTRSAHDAEGEPATTPDTPSRAIRADGAP